jgi:hypothetical protein
LETIAGQPPATADATKWLTIIDTDERDFPVAGVEQYRVQIAPPLDAPPGNYSFRLNMVSVANPDADFTQGPAVAFQVAPPPKVEAKKPFPWWIIAVVVGILVIAAVGIVLWRQSVNAQSARATATAQALFTRTAFEATQTAEAIALQTATAATATALANQTATAVAQQTATAIAQQTAVALQTASAQQTAEADALNRYIGSWQGNTSNPPYITKLSIQRDGANIKISLTGSARMVATGSAVASALCKDFGSSTADCTWGIVSVPYQGDPLTARVDQPNDLSHQVTFTVTPDGKAMSVIDQVFIGRQSQGITGYAFQRTTLKFPISDIVVGPVLVNPGLILRSVQLTPAP